MRNLKRLPVIAGTAAVATLSVGAILGAGSDDPALTGATPSEPLPLPVTTTAPAEPLPDVLPADPEQSAEPLPEATEPAAEWPVYEEAVPWVPGAPIDGVIREPYEDEPGFDCRIHGNNLCGVQVKGEWYVITFDESAKPVGVAPRGF